jgi:hypothetical protein
MVRCRTRFGRRAAAAGALSVLALGAVLGLGAPDAAAAGTTVPTVTLTAAPARIVTQSDHVSFTAHVAGSASTPTGRVTFAVDGDDLCDPVPVTAGVAVCSPSFLPPGALTVVAAYSGDATYATGRATLDYTVRAHTDITLTADPTGHTIKGHRFTLRIQVFPIAYAGTAPRAGVVTSGGIRTHAATDSGPEDVTGTVSVSRHGTMIHGCRRLTLHGGAATCRTSSLPVGRDTLVVRYSGDHDDVASSASITHRVVAASSSTSAAGTGSGAVLADTGAAVDEPLLLGLALLLAGGGALYAGRRRTAR